MVDVASPLDEHLAAGRGGSADKASITLSEVPTPCLFQLAAWPDTLSEVGAIGARAIGVSNAPGPGEAVSGEKGTLMRIEPLKWWLVAEDHVAIAPPDIPAAEGSFLDLSHSRTWLKVSGEKADVLLNHFLPIDLRERSFPAGSVASTAFHHVGVTLWRDERDFNLLLPRSFAQSLWEMLRDSAKQYGFEVT
jgi:heterotetrameric sarcosine oxidase gamma subunit